MELLLPRVVAPARPLPSYVKLDMAFGVGAGATLYDKSRYRSHGTISGALWAAGAHGYALDFEPATPSYVEIAADYDQLDFTSEDFSIIARINVDDLSIARFVIDRSTRSTSGYDLRVLDDGRVVFATSQVGADQYTYSTLGDIATGNWYTVGMSRDGASIRLYVNGVDTVSVAGTHIDPTTFTGITLVGIYGDKSYAPFDGEIEFLRVFGGIALLASEHLAWHNALT